MVTDLPVSNYGTELIMMTIAEITRKYMRQFLLTQEKFTEALCEHLVNTNISRSSVSYWLNGKYEPETDFLLICLAVHKDWRAEWAIECLCAKLPEVFDRNLDGRMIVLSNRIVVPVSSSHSA
jgi:hypothetical protein